MVEYETEHLYDPFDQKDFIDYFMRDQTFITLCSKCIHASAVGKLTRVDLQMLRMWLLQARIRLDPPTPGRHPSTSPVAAKKHGPTPEEAAAAAKAVAEALAIAEAASSSSEDSFSDDSPGMTHSSCHFITLARCTYVMDGYMIQMTMMTSRHIQVQSVVCTHRMWKAWVSLRNTDHHHAVAMAHVPHHAPDRVKVHLWMIPHANWSRHGSWPHANA